MENKKGFFCCSDKRFPTFAVIVLVIGIIWLLNDLKIFTVDIPWFPVILIIISLSWIINRYKKD